MTRGSSDFRVQALLSIQRALWDAVTPDLRAVTLRVQEPAIIGRFLYQNPPGCEQREIVSEVESYVIADFDKTVSVSFVAYHLPLGVSRDLREGEEWVFMRREEEVSG